MNDQTFCAFHDFHVQFDSCIVIVVFNKFEHLIQVCILVSMIDIIDNTALFALNKHRRCCVVRFAVCIVCGSGSRTTFH